MPSLQLDGSIDTKSLFTRKDRGGVDNVEDERGNEDGNCIEDVERPFVVEEIALRLRVKVDGGKFDCSEN